MNHYASLWYTHVIQISYAGVSWWSPDWEVNGDSHFPTDAGSKMTVIFRLKNNSRLLWHYSWLSASDVVVAGWPRDLARSRPLTPTCLVGSTRVDRLEWRENQTQVVSSETHKWLGYNLGSNTRHLSPARQIGVNFAHTSGSVVHILRVWRRPGAPIGHETREYLDVVVAVSLTPSFRSSCPLADKSS